MLYGLPDSKLQRLQRMQNLAVRIVSWTPKYDHITPFLKSLHWLPVKGRILFKILLLMHKSVNCKVPPYFFDMVLTCQPSWILRSAQQCLLFIPKAKSITFGERACPVTGPREWTSNRTGPFKAKLNTYLFPIFYWVEYCFAVFYRLNFVDFIVFILILFVL